LITPSNAQSSNRETETFQVTHPFHPLHGRTLVLVTHRRTWGEDRVYYHDDAGRLCSVPARWTSVSAPDPLVVVSRGRSPFRVPDLLELVRLIDGVSRDGGALGAPEDGGRGVKQNTPDM